MTGAAGFIGSNFLRYMFDKYPHYKFIVLDAMTYAGNMENIPDYIKNSDRFEFVYDTVTNQEVVDACMTKSDLVVHFAAESHVTRSLLNPRTFVETDVHGHIDHAPFLSQTQKCAKVHSYLNLRSIWYC